MAIDMLFKLLTAKPRLKGESHIQFDSMRWPLATFTSVWDSLLAGIDKRATFTMGGMKVMVTMCPTQQKWFGLFCKGPRTGWDASPSVISHSGQE